MQELFEPTTAPVWLAGRTREMNVLAGFRAVFALAEGQRAVVRLAASTLYRLHVNGAFAGYGPARCGHGVYRVDTWDVTEFCRVEDRNVLAIEVAGYNVDSFATLDQPSFLQAELAVDGQVVAATGASGFEATALPERLQRVNRYSYQRAFAEAWRLEPDGRAWMADAHTPLPCPAPVETLEPRSLVPRGIAYPAFDVVPAARRIARGEADALDAPAAPCAERWLANVGPGKSSKGYALDELELNVVDAFRRHPTRTIAPERSPAAERLPLGEHQFATFDMGRNLTGFVGLRVDCAERTRLLVCFAKTETEGDVLFSPERCDAVHWELAPGEYVLESMEPYVAQFIKVLVLAGACEIAQPFIREYTEPVSDGARFECSDAELASIFEAGRQTFRQNAVDVFMDCPSRERAGWLCDSFFTARVAHDLCGNTSLEKLFLENFVLATHFPDIADGMWPMCYPSDHLNGQFIPQWAMWGVAQLGEYLDRSGDRALVNDFAGLVAGLVDYLEGFANEDGLLERLPSWNFVEWSHANELVQDVSYPTNMLYASALLTAARLYGRDAWAARARAIRERVLADSFDGEYFVDNAVRNGDGELELSGERTEAAQYYAFFFDLVTPESHPALWRRLVDDFGPRRDAQATHPDIWPANALMGYYMRFDLLARYDETDALLRDFRHYFGPMTRITGTLWENASQHGSLNHGFASHACHTMITHFLGLAVDRVAKRVTFAPRDIGLEWFRLTLPLGDGRLVAAWEDGEASLSLPPGHVRGNEA